MRVERDSRWLQHLELLKQKYEKSAVDGVIEVLHSAAVAEEEIKHQCAALESTPTLTEFTEAMIEGRPIQERMRIHQSINKLIEQVKAKGNQMTPDPEPPVTRTGLKTDGGRSLQTRQPTKSNQKRKRKSDCRAEKDYHKHLYGDKLDYRPADARDTYHGVEHHGIVVNPLWPGIGCHRNSVNPKLAAISLGPPRQSKSHHHVPAHSVGKSVGCQAPSTAVTPEKKAEEESVKEKPDTSTGSIKILSPQNISSKSDGMTEAMILSPGKPSSTSTSTEHHDDDSHSRDFQQVLDICSHSTTNNSGITVDDMKGPVKGTGITVEGEVIRSTPDYQGPSFPPKPPERLSPYNVEPLTMSASELDKKLKENLEQKAMEWIHQELLVRLAAERKQDPVGHTMNSCSTCSSDIDTPPTQDLPGMHKLPQDEENECIKMLICEEVLALIKKALRERSCKKELRSVKESETSELDDASSTPCHLLTPAMTPPSTPTNPQSITSSSDHVTLVATPLPTPPQSPTLSVQQLVENSIQESVNDRIPTPQSSSSSASNSDVDDTLTHSVQPEIVDSNLSSPSTTQPTISASAHTPQTSTESTKKPQTEEKHAIDPNGSSTGSSSSSSTSNSPAVSDTTSSTTTTTTADQEISMGEYILAKPSVIQRAKKADYSLSEGEVPLSPGDARWGTLHASKLKRNLKEKKQKDITMPNHSVIEAFLDLKQAMSCEKDSDSATEFLADSLQLKPQQLLSNGEIQGRSHDPFKKFLDKLNSSSSSNGSSATPTAAQEEEDKDNTLSEVASFATQEDITSMIASSPPPAVTRKATSPGEITRNLSVLPAPPEDDERSLGEVTNSRVMAKVSRSPGEVPPILRASETRHGIDVIRISKWSDRPSDDNDRQPSAPITSESQYLMEQFDSSEMIHMSTSRSSSMINTKSYNSNSSSQLQADHTNTANGGSTESQPGNHIKSDTVGEVNRKVVTINIPGTSTGFHDEDSQSSNNNLQEQSTEMTFTISSLSSENF